MALTNKPHEVECPSICLRNLMRFLVLQKNTLTHPGIRKIYDDSMPKSCASPLRILRGNSSFKFKFTFGSVEGFELVCKFAYFSGFFSGVLLFLIFSRISAQLHPFAFYSAGRINLKAIQTKCSAVFAYPFWPTNWARPGASARSQLSEVNVYFIDLLTD